MSTAGMVAVDMLSHGGNGISVQYAHHVNRLDVTRNVYDLSIMYALVSLVIPAASCRGQSVCVCALAQ